MEGGRTGRKGGTEWGLQMGGGRGWGDALELGRFGMGAEGLVTLQSDRELRAIESYKTVAKKGGMGGRAN